MPDNCISIKGAYTLVLKYYLIALQYQQMVFKTIPSLRYEIVVPLIHIVGIKSVLWRRNWYLQSVSCLFWFIFKTSWWMLLLRERHSFFMFDLVSYVRKALYGKRQIGRNFGGLESSTKKKVIIISNLIKTFSQFLIHLGWSFVKHFYRLIMSTSGSVCEILCQRPSIPWYVCRNDAKFSLLRNFHHLDIMFH